LAHRPESIGSPGKDSSHQPAAGWSLKYGVPPGKAGKYFFGDIASGRVFFTNVDQLAKATPFFELPLIYSGKQQSLREIMHADRADLRFGQDELGEIYLLTKQDGVIRKLAVRWKPSRRSCRSTIR